MSKYLSVLIGFSGIKNRKQVDIIQQICKSFMYFKVIYGNQIHVMNSKEAITYAKLQAFIKSVFKKLPAKYTLSYKDTDEDMICLLNDTDMKILTESGMTKVRIEIQECSEDFYDQTQQISIPENPIIKQEEKIEVPKTEVTVEQIPEVQMENQSTVSQVKSIDESISEKLNKMLPELVSKIKEQVITESKIREPKVAETQPEIKMEESIPSTQEQNKVVHAHVTCDECKAFPIVGIRYKCVVCPDFDVCEKCEAKSTHDHPFLKIKYLRHTPMKIFAVIDDDKEESLEINGQKLPLPGLNQGLNLLRGFLGGNMKPEQCQRQFGQCRENFKKMAHNFKQFMHANNKKFECPYMKKQNEEKCEQKVEQKPVVTEPKVEQVKVEAKKEEVPVPAPVKQQKKVEEKKEEPKKAEKKRSQQDIFIEAANYICEIMNQDFRKAYRFVTNYPGMTKQEILMKYLEQ